RRTLDKSLLQSDRVVRGDIAIDPKGRSVEVAGAHVELTVREFDLLWFLVNHPGEVFTREQLLTKVWKYEWFGDASTVTVHIRRLRTKVEREPESPRHIQTVWGVGYRWDD